MGQVCLYLWACTMHMDSRCVFGGEEGGRWVVFTGMRGRGGGGMSRSNAQECGSEVTGGANVSLCTAMDSVSGSKCLLALVCIADA